jgi:hypothetical protein
MSDGEEAPESLTGVWHGQYTYPMGLMAPTAFTATLMDISGALSGTTHEATDRGGKNATLDGARDGAAVRFVKVYSPASEEYQDVIYIGTLSSDRTEIEGEWLVPGTWAGKFLMIRSRGTAKAATRGVKKEVDA